jgi:hypothetical protein
MKAERPQTGPDRDNYILYGRDHVGRTFASLAGELGVSIERVRQRYLLVTRARLKS